MEDLRTKIIVAIISALFGGGITGGINYFTSDKDKLIKRSEDIIAENTRLKNSINEQIININQLKDDLLLREKNYNELKSGYDQLVSQYSDLDQKYQRCISSNGIINNVGSIDLTTYTSNLKTGDNLKFDLTSSPLIIKFIRVTDRGPVIEIYGCFNYLTLNSVSIDSNHYLLQLGNPLKIRFTSKSCENDLLIEPSELEEIQIKLFDFNVTEQTFKIEYSRDFLIK